MGTAVDSRPATSVRRTAPQRRGCFDEAVQGALVQLSRAFTFAMLDGTGRANAGIFATNGVFLGGLFNETRGGVDAYLRFNEQLTNRNLRIVLARPSIVARPIEWDDCLVIASFHLFLSEGSSQNTVMSRPLRIVYDWHLTDDVPRIRLLELSFPPAKRDLPPSAETRAEQRRSPVNAGVRDVFEERLLEVHNQHRGLVIIGYDDILSIEADGRKSRIHLRDGVLDVSESIGQITRLLTNADGDTLPFIQVHRSYLVNAWHLRSLSAESAELDDGSVVNVSARRLSQIRAQIRELRRPRSLPVREFVQIVRDAMGETEGR